MLRRTIASLIATSLVLACNDASGPERGVGGVWRLETVNGQSLPFVLPPVEFDKVELMSDVLTFVAPQNFSEVTDFRLTKGTTISTETIPSEGTYSINGSSVTMVWKSDGFTIVATVKNDMMTMVDEGLTFVYRRD